MTKRESVQLKEYAEIAKPESMSLHQNHVYSDLNFCISLFVSLLIVFNTFIFWL